MVAVRNVLKRAVKEGLIRSVPKVDPLRTVTEKRRLLTADEIDRLCALATDGWSERGKRIQLVNGQQFTDCIRLMAYCGVRYKETISLCWTDVDFKRGQVHFRGTETKNSEHRTVDFNWDLERHLRDMHERRAPDSEYCITP
jgi:integrase